jgi:chemotaxis protein MotB
MNWQFKIHETMKTSKIIFALGVSTLLVSCVSSKKFAALNSNYQKTLSGQKDCESALSKSQSMYDDMTKKNKELTDQVNYLKKNSNQVLGALQDMSVLSSKQAESVKESLKSLSEKDNYINGLQAAIRRKDSLNMNLVMNLKSSLANVNDKDINIKIEKGVVYVDISDKLLFNSGQYTITESAKNVLGKIATILNAHPELDVMVEGHTDSIPIHNAILADNWDLSVKRATSVVRILEKEYKINPTRMTASGHSKFIPVASNATADGRALNRRTRIIILPELDQFFKLMIKK